MKMVIDISEEIYTYILSRYKYQDKTDIGLSGFDKVGVAIKNGTPLPEHHGDLIDRDAIEVLRIGNIKREYDKGFDAGVTCMVNRILEAPTIIEGSDSE